MSLNEADRKNNAGSSTTLYKMGGTSNATNINDSTAVLTAAGMGGDTYRNGQADTVNKAAGTTATIAKNGTSNIGGTFGVDNANDLLTFQINIAGTDMMNWDSFAIHWGETRCIVGVLCSDTRSTILTRFFVLDCTPGRRAPAR